jgi:hypothetical protein
MPGHITSLRPAASVRVTAIDGIALPLSPSGTFGLPDVVINKNTPVNVDIEATGVPPGTVVTLHVYPDTPGDVTIVNLPPVDVTLQGADDLLTATVPFTFPYGFSRGWLSVTFTQ